MSQCPSVLWHLATILLDVFVAIDAKEKHTLLHERWAFSIRRIRIATLAACGCRSGNGGCDGCDGCGILVHMPAFVFVFVLTVRD